MLSNLRGRGFQPRCLRDISRGTVSAVSMDQGTQKQMVDPPLQQHMHAASGRAQSDAQPAGSVARFHRPRRRCCRKVDVEPVDWNGWWVQICKGLAAWRDGGVADGRTHVGASPRRRSGHDVRAAGEGARWCFTRPRCLRNRTSSAAGLGHLTAAPQSPVQSSSVHGHAARKAFAATLPLRANHDTLRAATPGMQSGARSSPP